MYLRDFQVFAVDFVLFLFLCVAVFTIPRIDFSFYNYILPSLYNVNANTSA